MVGALSFLFICSDKEGYDNSKIFFLFLNESIHVCCGLHHNCLIDESLFMFFFFSFFMKICEKLSLNYPSYSYLEH